MMHYYTAYGFNIYSEIGMRILPERQPFSAPDITVRNGDLSAQTAQGNFTNKKEYFRIRKGLGSILVSGGSEITVDRIDGVTDDQIAMNFPDGPLYIAAQQRGFSAMHASVVCREGEAVLICGKSGAGKSTLAAEFLGNGWQFMADSVAVIEHVNGRLCVRAAYPCRKLWQDAVEHYSVSQEDLVPLASDKLAGKYYVKEDNYYEGTLPVLCIVGLKDSDSMLHVHSAGIREKLRILRGCFLRYPGSSRQTKLKSFLKLLYEVQGVKTLQVVRDNDLRNISSVYDEIMDNLMILKRNQVSGVRY